MGRGLLGRVRHVGMAGQGLLSTGGQRPLRGCDLEQEEGVGVGWPAWQSRGMVSSGTHAEEVSS